MRRDWSLITFLWILSQCNPTHSSESRDERSSLARKKYLLYAKIFCAQKINTHNCRFVTEHVTHLVYWSEHWCYYHSCCCCGGDTAVAVVDNDVGCDQTGPKIVTDWPCLRVWVRCEPACHVCRLEPEPLRKLHSSAGPPGPALMPGPAGSFAMWTRGHSWPGQPGHTENTGDPGITDRQGLAHSDRLTTCDEKNRDHDYPCDLSSTTVFIIYGRSKIQSESADPISNLMKLHFQSCLFTLLGEKICC